MASIICDLSKKTDGYGKSQVMVRLVVSQHIKFRYKSGVFIKPAHFKVVKTTNHGQVFDIVIPQKGKSFKDEFNDIQKAKNDLDLFTGRLVRICQVVEAEKFYITRDFMEKYLENAQRVLIANDIPNDKITFDLINDLVDREQQIKEEKIAKEKKRSLKKLEDDYMSETQLSESRRKHFRVVFCDIERFEAYTKLKANPDYVFDVETVTKEDIMAFEKYIRNENTYISQNKRFYNEIFKKQGCHQAQRPKGNNAVVSIMKKVRAFFNWCLRQNDIKAKYPFGDKGYKINAEVYGDPYYLSIETRNLIADYDLSGHPSLEVQRDIFIFHCFVGCRVSDLIKLTSANITDGFIHYIAVKTKDSEPRTVEVPLSEKALSLIEKYKGVDKKGRLFPFISDQKYNDSIKEVFTLCEVNYTVTVRNSLTGDGEERPINEIASSHLARRTFTGNCYKLVKDPNLVASMTGHVEGSKAFARYRKIDNEMKQELIKKLE